MGTPFVGYSNNTLDDLPRVKAGDEVICPHCNERHTLIAPDSGNHLILFYRCAVRNNSYLAAIDGKLVAYAKPDISGSL